jgi:L-ascorbate metabolism protein UlaG (beta-lactamase superfamily)
MEREGRTLLFGGDTAYTDSLAQLKSRRIEAAIMPIGCYGRSSQTHCTPEEAVKMTDSARAEFIVPVHHSTFPLGREPISEPLERLERVLSPDRIGIRRVGETWRVPC